MARALLVLAAAALLVAVWWFGSAPGLDAPHPVDVGPEPGPRAPSDLEGPGDVAAAPRAAATTAGESDAPDTPGPIAPADGLVVVLHDARGERVPDTSITVHWRKGFGDYGEDEGRTDDHGQFATTVAEAFMVEDVTVRHPDWPYELDHPGGEFEGDPAEPGVLRVGLPARGELTVEARDLGGRPAQHVGLFLEPTDTLPLDPYLHELGSAGRLQETDDSGRLVIPLPHGEWTVSVGRTPLWLTDETPRVVLDAAHPRRTVSLELLGPEDRRELEVRVVHPPDVQGTPTLELDGFLGTTGWRIVERAAYEGDGRWSITVPIRGSWSLRGRLEGCEPAEVPIPVGATRLVVHFVARPPEAPKPTLRGRVVSAETGAPLRASIEQLSGPSAGSSSGDRCDAQGRFEVTASWFRPLYVRASLRGYAWQMVGPIDPDTFQGELDVRLHPAHELAGTVVDARGAAVPATVLLYRSNQQLAQVAGLPTVEGVLDTSVDRLGMEDGTFRFRGVTTGLNELWVDPKDPALPPARARVRGGRTDVVIVVGEGLDGLATLRGTVRDGLTGAPLPHVHVGLEGPERWARDSGFSAADGSYVLAGVEPGTYAARLELDPERPEAYAFRAVEGVALEAGDNARDFELLPARHLALHVLDVDRAPLRGGRVEIADPSGARVRLQDRYGHDDGYRARIDAAGRVDLRGLPAAEVRIEVWTAEQDEEEVPAGAFRLDLTDVRRELIELVLKH